MVKEIRMVILREKEPMEKGRFSDEKGWIRKEKLREYRQKKIEKIGFAVDIGTTSIVAAGFLLFWKEQGNRSVLEL